MYEKLKRSCNLIITTKVVFARSMLVYTRKKTEVFYKKMQQTKTTERLHQTSACLESRKNLDQNHTQFLHPDLKGAKMQVVNVQDRTEI